MAGSHIKVTLLRDGDHTKITLFEQRGDKTLRTLRIGREPNHEDLARLEAFINGRKCNCKGK